MYKDVGIIKHQHYDNEGVKPSSSSSWAGHSTSFKLFNAVIIKFAMLEPKNAINVVDFSIFHNLLVAYFSHI